MSDKKSLLCHMKMLLEDGSTADSTYTSGKPLRFNMGDGSLSLAFEHELQNLNQGDSHCFTLPAQDAFGEINPDAIQHVDKSRFNSTISLEVGTIVNFEVVSGTEMPGVIREVIGDSVTVDFNHPLAGQKITFELEVIKVF